MTRVLLIAALVAAALYLLWRKRQADAGSGDEWDTANAYNSGGGDLDAAEGGSMADSLRKWAEAIMHFEGGKPGDRNMRNNNPGNIKYSPSIAGAIGADKDGFAIFPSQELGMAALEGDLRAKVSKYSDWSLLDVMRRYLGGGRGIDPPAAEGNAQAYANYIAQRIGANSSDTLGEIFG